jgi:oligopeptide/dipeptide ABC transporter ATP-binding protein
MAFVIWLIRAAKSARRPKQGGEVHSSTPMRIEDNGGDPSLLNIQELSVVYKTDRGDVMAVQDANFSLERGQVLGLVGESGCGKSTLGLALLRLLTWPGQVQTGHALLRGRDLFSLSNQEMRTLRGDRIAMVFQNPMNSLNPTESVGAQIAEIITAHRNVGKSELHERCVELLELVGIPGARERVSNYPHEFSGGMRQRVLIALALALDPDILVADEPTTALDLTVQGQILWLLEDVQSRSGMAMIYITHDLAVAASVSQRIAVMYAGWIVEIAPTTEVFSSPAHPYTLGLIASVPQEHWKERKVAAIPGQPPELLNLPAGCPFAPRCPRVTETCRERMPNAEEIAPNHVVRCFHVIR